MKFKNMLLMLCVSTLTGILPAIAAEEQPPTIAIGYLLKIKPGHVPEFEAGLKKQIEWYKQNNETWHWHAWESVTGENTGQFFFRSPGHHWKDFDDRSERTARARAHFEETVRPHLESMQGSLGQVLTDVSNWPDDLGMVPMVSVKEFNIHYGMSEEFVNLIGKINGAIKKSNWGAHYAWMARVSGGEVPAFALVIPHENWADMAGPEKPFRTMLEEALGRAETESVMAGLRKCVRKETVELARFRPELSYIPPGE